MQTAQRDDGTAAFTAVRRRLFGIAYRMLGTVADAEDVVQDAWLRWQQTDRDAVRDPAAFLATVATRLSITAATSAQATRVTYIGPWLPEPVQTAADPTLGAETAEAVELAVLVLLERLTPTERAAYILREAFGYGFREIGDVLQTSRRTPASSPPAPVDTSRVSDAGRSGAPSTTGCCAHFWRPPAPATLPPSWTFSPRMP